MISWGISFPIFVSESNRYKVNEEIKLDKTKLTKPYKTLQDDIPGDCKQQSNTVMPVNNR
jgi:hypothetical protein